MKNSVLSWLAGRITPKPLDPVVHQIGFKAVEDALEASATLDGSTPTGPIAFIEPGRMITARDTSTPAYHLDLTEKMIQQLEGRITKAETARDEQRNLYEADRLERHISQERSDDAQADELVGLRKSLAAYHAARLVLLPATERAARDVQDVELSTLTPDDLAALTAKPPNTRERRAARRKPIEQAE